MGDEIFHIHFRAQDFEIFRQRLAAETRLLQRWFEEKSFSGRVPVCGLELETWLIDSRALPMPVNQQLLQALNDPMVVPELARFNVELNVQHPRRNCKGSTAKIHKPTIKTFTS